MMNLSQQQMNDVIETLKNRFMTFQARHPYLEWKAVEDKIRANEQKLRSLVAMEQTGGEPDVVGYDEQTNEYIFIDCSPESPQGRRSLCYDREALDKRKQNKPSNSAVDVANEMGISILTEVQYHHYQQFGPFDQKTSSWISTPSTLRKLGGALFGDYRYGRVFIYHNGADSYYGARGFRGLLRL